jgi:hypothetical protein
VYVFARLFFCFLPSPPGRVVEAMGIEPTTYGLQSRRSAN